MVMRKGIHDPANFYVKRAFFIYFIGLSEAYKKSHATELLAKQDYFLHRLLMRVYGKLRAC